MNILTEPDTDATISRIAGRMVHRANDILGTALTGPGFIGGVREQIERLKKRDPAAEEPALTAQKLADLEEREARLLVAAADYKRAEKIIRLFPVLVWATRAGLDRLGESQDIAVQQIAKIMKRALGEAEEALR